MSKIKIQGNASGTGVLTIEAPNTNTDRTITLPDATGEILTSTSSISQQSTKTIPFFHATMSANQSVSNTTFTTVAFNTETIDTEGWYDNTTYRFTPQVAGWYRFDLKFTAGTSNVLRFIGALGISGSSGDADRIWDVAGLSETPGMSGSYYVHLNGTTDYVEARAWLNTTGTPQINRTDGTFFSGELVRAD